MTYDHAGALAAIRRARAAQDADVTAAADELGAALGARMFAALPDLDRHVIAQVVLCLTTNLAAFPRDMTLGVAVEITSAAVVALDAGVTT